MCRREDYPPYERTETLTLLDFLYHGHNVHLVTDTYVSGSLAVRVIGEDGEPWATLSVNLPESKDLPADHWYGKNWSENTDIMAAALAAGVIEAANPFIYPPARAGYAQANVYMLRPAKAAEEGVATA